MMLIDTHCHLNHERFAADLGAAIARALDAGVERMIVVGADMPSTEAAVRLAETHAPHLYATVGVHPHDAKDWSDRAAGRLRELAEHPRVVAIGEIGLDFHYDFSPREHQYVAFRAQMGIAREAALPVVIHCREAYPETLALLAEEQVQAVGGVMHCWAGSVDEAKATVELGMYLGFGGTLTFKNAQETRDSAAAAPLDRILLETDAPYLAPVPHRGKRNEPSYVSLVAEALAAKRGLPVSGIARDTTANARRLFARLG